MLNSGERQVAPSLAGIRRDHVARYEWAAAQLPPASRVLDLGCGIGYGSRILAEAGHTVRAFDVDVEAIRYAHEHYAHERVKFFAADASSRHYGDRFDAVVAFEFIEHVADPLPILKLARQAAPLLLASVPNEDEFPFIGYAFHHRHYTPYEFKALLRDAGFQIASRWGQLGPQSEVEADISGRTFIVSAVRAAKKPPGPAPRPALRLVSPRPSEPAKVPERVAILGLGPSLEMYLDHVKRVGSRTAFADEVWAINALGDVVQCDRIFHMDDVRIQERRSAAAPDSNIARMLEWMKVHPGPIYTSQAHPDYPGLVEFPLAEVMTSLGGLAYFNSTAAYAVAYAIHLGVKEIALFGYDFTYPNAHQAEKGRACVEFWLGFATVKGIQIGLPQNTTLMDMFEPADRKFYGYDMVEVRVEHADDGVKIAFTPRASTPSAAEIEERYDHSKHPARAVMKG